MTALRAALRRIHHLLCDGASFGPSHYALSANGCSALSDEETSDAELAMPVRGRRKSTSIGEDAQGGDEVDIKEDDTDDEEDEEDEEGEEGEDLDEDV